MRIMITGSRDWKDSLSIHSALVTAVEGAPSVQHVVIHGDCRGADKLAARLAESMGWRVQAYPVEVRKGAVGWEWAQAARARNKKMAESNPDVCLAFWMPGVKGTKHAYECALAAGVPVRIYPSSPQ